MAHDCELFFVKLRVFGNRIYIDEDDRPRHFGTSVATERKCIVTFFGPLTLDTEDVV